MKCLSTSHCCLLKFPAVNLAPLTDDSVFADCNREAQAQCPWDNDWGPGCVRWRRWVTAKFLFHITQVTCHISYLSTLTSSFCWACDEVFSRCNHFGICKKMPKFETKQNPGPIHLSQRKLIWIKLANETISQLQALKFHSRAVPNLAFP